MRINELSKMTGVNSETIRMYRKLGFLKPLQDENGYYNYASADFVSLVYLRKLRDFSFPIDDIQTFCRTDAAQPLLDLIDAKEAELQKQIQLLQEKLRLMEVERRHIAESHDAYEAENKVSCFQSLDEKIDFYENKLPFAEGDTPSIENFYLNSTPCLFIPKDILNGPVENRQIPLKAGVGVYRHFFSEPFKVPEQAIIVPNGICIAQFITLKDLDQINVQQLAPMMNFARHIGKQFISDTTGYLAGISEADGKRIYNFRIRACIEANDIVDPEVDEYLNAYRK